MIRTLILALAVLVSPAWGQTVPEPEGFRGEPYRAPVPQTLAGARVIDAAEAIALHDGGAAFLDILPRKTRPEGLPPETLWREPPHDSIPGSIWLWNTGYEALSEDEQSRLRMGLTAAQSGDPERALVFFCRRDCWMSWNAAKRAVEWGFGPVIWFPGGTEAWTEAGGAPLVPATPFEP